MKDLYINKHSVMGMLSKNQTIIEAKGFQNKYGKI